MGLFPAPRLPGRAPQGRTSGLFLVLMPACPGLFRPWFPSNLASKFAHSKATSALFPARCRGPPWPPGSSLFRLCVPLSLACLKVFFSLFFTVTHRGESCPASLCISWPHLLTLFYLSRNCRCQKTLKFRPQILFAFCFLMFKASVAILKQMTANSVGHPSPRVHVLSTK